MEEQIIQILAEINPEIISYSGNDMAMEGIIDSLTVINILTRIEDEFHIEIDVKYVIAENFANKEAIIRMVRHVLGEKKENKE